MVPFEVHDDRTVSADRLQFVSYPFEWCDAQLFEAAQLTLQLQQEAVAASFDLKDASAWNIVFDGVRPVFCDLMSFQRLDTLRWWAAGQFARHFVIPLVLARRRGLHVHAAFKNWRDGVPPDVARSVLGPSRFLTRYWPLVADGKPDHANRSNPPMLGEPTRDDRVLRFRTRLHATLEWMLQGAKPTSNATAGWQNYEVDREHYRESSLDAKRSIVERWIARIGPSWVADLGCNTGEFSRLALASGAEVVAIDADHECIQSLFLATPKGSRLHPLVAQLDDLAGGRGWQGAEYPGLMQRIEGRFDVVMMLALIHHLMVAAAVPLQQIAALAERLSRGWVIVEWIGEQDPQLQLLCEQRRRLVSDFSMERQRAAFESAGFVVEEEANLPNVCRSLALLKKAPSAGDSFCSGATPWQRVDAR